MGADASQGANDSMVVNGSTSNGIERRAFGNGRRGPGSLFNGNLSLIESNSALNARSYSLTGQDTAQPANNNATFAGSFGGPLWIPHVLRRNGQFFILYQGTRSRNCQHHAGAHAHRPGTQRGFLADRDFVGPAGHHLRPQRRRSLSRERDPAVADRRRRGRRPRRS